MSGFIVTLLRKARWLLRHHPDVMLLADRGESQSRVDEVVTYLSLALLFAPTL